MPLMALQIAVFANQQVILIQEFIIKFGKKPENTAKIMHYASLVGATYIISRY